MTRALLGSRRRQNAEMLPTADTHATIYLATIDAYADDAYRGIIFRAATRRLRRHARMPTLACAFYGIFFILRQHGHH